MLDAYLYDGLRTPIGRHAGKLAPVRPDDLAAEVIREVVARNKIDPAEISDVVLGCVNQAGEDSRNVARFAALLAGLPPTTPGVTVNRLCASGLQAVVDAARAITCGEGDLYVAGGVESMSRAPYVMSKSDSPYSRDVKMYDTTIGSRFPNPKVVKQFGNHTMPETGDNVAKDFGITREQADEFALASQQKYAKAEKEGFYKGEILADRRSRREKGCAARSVQRRRASAPRLDDGIAGEAEAAVRRRRGHRRQRLGRQRRRRGPAHRLARAWGDQERQETHGENPRRPPAPAWSRASWASGRRMRFRARCKGRA